MLVSLYAPIPAYLINLKEPKKRSIGPKVTK
jgi:hypothetical protein